MDLRFTINLEPVTKKNSQRIVRCGRFTKILPSKKYEEYVQQASLILPYQGQRINQPIEVTALFYMGTKRKVDLTNLLEALDDLLVYCKVLEDDNSRIIVSHDGSRVLYDKAFPRTEVRIRCVG